MEWNAIQQGVTMWLRKIYNECFGDQVVMIKGDENVSLVPVQDKSCLETCGKGKRC
jgi:hypothetical protein